MKNFTLLAVGLALMLAPAATLRADPQASPIITSLVITNGQASLAWTNSRPTFQVQMRADLTAPWVNVGSPTSNYTATVAVSNAQTFLRVISDFTARYQVVFNATWSQVTHPTNWPVNPHFSGLVGGTHNSTVHFFREGETASEGIRVMAELGGKTTLLNVIAPAITNGTAHLQLSGNGISPSPGSVSLTFPAPMRRDFPLVTLVSMIAPSPDWFVGVDSLNLITNGQWATNLVVALYGRDAGTDSGPSYSSADSVTAPRGVVTTFTGFPAIQNGVVVPFGTYTFTRLD